MKVFTIKAASQVTGGCTQTSKMPCKSYSLPTSACITGGKLREMVGSVCADCYADKGFYKMYKKTIEPAQKRRLASINDPQWVDAMVTLIGTDPYFRWHDSGDIQSIKHLSLIIEVCKRTPMTRHWLPTKEYAIVRDYSANNAVPGNLVIRLSALYVDKQHTVPLWAAEHPQIAFSTVFMDKDSQGYECNAPKQNGKCDQCRACWNPEVYTVAYKKH